MLLVYFFENLTSWKACLVACTNSVRSQASNFIYLITSWQQLCKQDITTYICQDRRGFGEVVKPSQDLSCIVVWPCCLCFSITSHFDHNLCMWVHNHLILSRNRMWMVSYYMAMRSRRMQWRRCSAHLSSQPRIGFPVTPKGPSQWMH